MINAPVLAMSNFSLPFTLEFDASGVAMGAVLLRNPHLISFFSKLFYPRLQRSSKYICELHAITTAVHKWRHYLLGHPFVILIDHQSLRDLMSQVKQTPEQQIYLAKLLGYNYTIQHKSSSTNIVADAFSRIPSI